MTDYVDATQGISIAVYGEGVASFVGLPTYNPAGAQLPGTHVDVTVQVKNNSSWNDTIFTAIYDATATCTTGSDNGVGKLSEYREIISAGATKQYTFTVILGSTSFTGCIKTGHLVGP